MASSASTLIPSNPEQCMVFRRLAPAILTCSTPFYRFGRIKIGGRGTVVRLRSGALAVFSPVALTETVKQQMQEQLGSTNVRYLAALDQEHHIFLENWHKAWPEARVLAPETLPAHRDKQNYFKIPPENWKLYAAGKRDDWSVDAEFDAEFDAEYVDVHINKELVFNHRPSRTLIEGDLLFNLPAHEQFSKSGDWATTGLLTKLFNAINTTHGAATWQKRFLWYGASKDDRPRFNDSIAKIAGWDFDAIVPCHGESIETGGKGVFEKVMAWHLEQKNKAT